jgi:hypothetical protein
MPAPGLIFNPATAYLAPAVMIISIGPAEGIEIIAGKYNNESFFPD